MPTPGIKGFRSCLDLNWALKEKRLARRKIEGRVTKENMESLEVERIWYAKKTASGAGAPEPREAGKNGRKYSQNTC